MTSRQPLCYDKAWADYVSANGGTGTLSNSNQTVRIQWPNALADGVRVSGGMGRRNGKRYVEWTIVAIATGPVCLGIGLINDFNYAYNTPTPPQAQFGGGLGELATDVIYRSDAIGGVCNVGSPFVAFGASFGAGDVIGLAVDFDNNTFSWYKNGVSQGAPASVPSPGAESQSGWVPFFATAGNSGLDGTVTINGGENGFTYAAPAGYQPWGVGAELDPAYSPGAEAALSSDNLTTSGGSESANYGRTSGKYYFETTFTSGVIGSLYTGICAQDRMYGQADIHNPNRMGILWGDAASFGIYPATHGVFQENGNFHDMGAGSATYLSSTAGFGIDLDAKTFNFFIGGVLKYSFGFSGFTAQYWYPWLTAGGGALTINLNPSSPPSGYTVWGATDFVPDPLQADFTVTNGDVPFTCIPVNTSTIPGHGETVTYDWDWGDGSAHSTSANPTHVYSSTGTFTITLTITTSLSRVSTYPQTTTVSNDITIAGKVATTLAGIPITTALPVIAGIPTTWSITGNPAWITVNAITGLISVNPPAGINKGFEITVTATDGFTSSSSTLILYVGTQVPLPPLPNDGQIAPGVRPSQVRDYTRRNS